MNKKHIIGYTATGLIALGIGSAAGSSSNDTAAAAATSTTTILGTASTVTAPGATTVVTKSAAAAPAKTVTAEPKAPSAASTIPGNGTFAVGSDVKSGTYVSTTADSGNCYWARLSGDNGNLDNILDNNNSSGQSLVTIRASDKYFETSGCNTWTRR